ncbi:MAG: hypothetical protein JXR77_14045 [Lentisphaeria bacterium]|nr:hypothetical protein [Lentisphaeria bacterium]
MPRRVDDVDLAGLAVDSIHGAIRGDDEIGYLPDYGVVSVNQDLDFWTEVVH